MIQDLLNCLRVMRAQGAGLDLLAIALPLCDDVPHHTLGDECPHVGRASLSDNLKQQIRPWTFVRGFKGVMFYSLLLWSEKCCILRKVF